MKTFEELRAFIEIETAKYDAIDEGEHYENLWECDVIYTRVFKEIAIFALNEGLVLNDVDLALYVENLHKTRADFIDAEEWQDWDYEWTNESNEYAEKIGNALFELANKKQLPEKTQILHDLWLRGFYPHYFEEDDNI